ncbi:fumarylacetoacetate hydrolase family protein [Clostridiaceae bacterium 35-E11]
MYFATYKGKNGEEVGVLNKEKTGVISLKNLYEQFRNAEGFYEEPKNMLQVIETFDEAALEKVEHWIKEDEAEAMTMTLEDLTLCAPIMYPRRNIFCVGKNYLDHAKEVGAIFGATPEHPTFFSKIAYPAIGDQAYIDRHAGIVEELDYEVELAVVIGKKGKNIPKEAAEDYIFGYTILNDVSARKLQKKHEQWHKGKSLDTFCPMGPFLVHKKEIPNPQHLDIVCKVNQEIRQNSSTKNLIFDIPTLIHVLSQGMTLIPGDIIATGTPAGVGMGFNPGKYLQAGDVITCEIEKIGKLTNVVK